MNAKLADKTTSKDGHKVTEQVTKSFPTIRITLAEKVGERIKWARERKELTQKELARLSGKSRASIVQYEQGKINAPLEVVEELAQKLGVAPEFLAFGRTGISGIRNAEEEVLVVKEYSGTGSQLVVNGGWAIPRSITKEYDAADRSLQFVCLPTDEPKFDVRAGDRVLVDTTTTVNKDGFYVVLTPFGARMIRLSLGYASGAGVRVMSGSDGSEENVDPANLELVGRVIGTFRRTF